MGNKERAVDFLVKASANKVQEAYAAYVHPSFIHHSPYFKGDRETFQSEMEKNCREYPDKRYEALHALEDGDLVAVHGRVVLGDKVFGVIHLFRFEGTMIVESWEASQLALSDSPNENGLF